MLSEIFRIEVWELNGVPDKLDGIVKPPYVLVTNIRHLLQDQAINLALGKQAVCE